MRVQREGEEETRWTLKMKIEDMNRNVLYQCSQRDNGEDIPV